MARKLILAEKPAVARDLARALGLGTRGEGSFSGERYVITWCIGHLVELSEPAEYNPAWRRWSMATLPMLPERFQLRPSAATARQWRVVRDLLRQRDFTAVINACDAGREGELIFRYCYELAGCRLPIERLWISSLTEQAIAQGFSRLRPGSELDALAAAARCRSEADWLVGMNATRAVTLWRRSEQDVLCSLGRVQTPTLGLLAAREKAIVEFVPRDYFEVHAELSATAADAAAGRFTAVWKHGPQRRLSARPLAESIVGRDEPLTPVVESVEEKTVREPPPLLFDLGALQQTANRRFGWSAKHTLSIAQALYEQHKLITYPRTDSRHLGTDLIPQLPKIFAAITEQPALAPLLPTLTAAKPPRRVFQDAKVTDHHAIIPTPVAHTPARIAALSPDESKLLDLVVRRFLAAFFPDAEFVQTRIVVCVGQAPAAPERSPRQRAAPRAQPGPAPDTDATAKRGEVASPDAAAELITELPPLPDRYYAQGRVRVRAGWQEVAGISEERSTRARGAPAARGSDAAAEEEDETDAAQPLPRLQRGQPLHGSYEVKAKQTQPPPRYNEATLLSAMEGAGKQLDDEALQEAMKDRGLGTPATRAAIIETLLDRSYVVRHGKQLQPTPLGMDLIARLPVPSLGSAQLTGQWEERLSRMARGQESRAAFMKDIAAYVQEIISAVRSAPPPAAVALSAPSPRPAASANKGRSPAAPSSRSRTAAPRRRKDADETVAVDAKVKRRTTRAAKPRARAEAEALPVGTAKKPRRKTAAIKAPTGRTNSRKVAGRDKTATPTKTRATTSAGAERHLDSAERHAGSAERHSGFAERHSGSAERVGSAGRHADSEERHSASEERHSGSGERHSGSAERYSGTAERNSGFGARFASAPLSLLDSRPQSPSARPSSRPAVLDPPGREAPGPACADKPVRSEMDAAPAGQGAAAPPPSSGAAAVGRPVAPELRCPRCRAGFLIWGRRAWGCSNFRTCPLIVPYEFRGRRLGERDLRNLIERGESLPMLLCADSSSEKEVRARLRLSLSGQPDGFLTMVPLAAP